MFQSATRTRTAFNINIGSWSTAGATSMASSSSGRVGPAQPDLTRRRALPCGGAKTPQRVASTRRIGLESEAQTGPAPGQGPGSGQPVPRWRSCRQLASGTFSRTGRPGGPGPRDVACIQAQLEHARPRWRAPGVMPCAAAHASPTSVSLVQNRRSAPGAPVTRRRPAGSGAPCRNPGPLRQRRSLQVRLWIPSFNFQEAGALSASEVRTDVLVAVTNRHPAAPGPGRRSTFKFPSSAPGCSLRFPSLSRLVQHLRGGTTRTARWQVEMQPLDLNLSSRS
jgi:hypothetical protein